MLRISLVTLGVADVPAATRFYEALGLKKSHISGDSVAFFQLGPVVLALFGRDAAREDGNAGSVWTGNGGITLAQNVAGEAEVDAIIARAAAAGATVLKEPQRAFWGGYHAFFADPGRACLGGRPQSRLRPGRERRGDPSIKGCVYAHIDREWSAPKRR